MIPRDNIQAWTANAPWPDLRQVEQDLIISRALCDLFNNPVLKGKIAFRGGTALNKLLFQKPLRYSEDIDLVQTEPIQLRETYAAIRDSLSWLGKFSYDQASHSLHFGFQIYAGDRIWHHNESQNRNEHTRAPKPARDKDL